MQVNITESVSDLVAYEDAESFYADLIDYDSDDDDLNTGSINQVKIDLSSEDGLIQFEFSYFDEPPVSQLEMLQKNLNTEKSLE